MANVQPSAIERKGDRYLYALWGNQRSIITIPPRQQPLAYDTGHHWYIAYYPGLGNVSPLSLAGRNQNPTIPIGSGMILYVIIDDERLKIAGIPLEPPGSPGCVILPGSPAQGCIPWKYTPTVATSSLTLISPNNKRATYNMSSRIMKMGLAGLANVGTYRVVSKGKAHNEPWFDYFLMLKMWYPTFMIPLEYYGTYQIGHTFTMRLNCSSVPYITHSDWTTIRTSGGINV